MRNLPVTQVTWLSLAGMTMVFQSLFIFLPQECTVLNVWDCIVVTVHWQFSYHLLVMSNVLQRPVSVFHRKT